MNKSAFDTMIPVARPFLPSLDEYSQGLKNVWERVYLSNGGPELKAFEAQLAELCATPNTMLFSNGSLALEAMLEMFELDGEVILPTFTFAATANAVVRAGLTPVFADIEPDRLTIDPDHVAQLCNERTVAIMGVHMFGMPCLVDELAAIAHEKDVPLIYDGAHAFALTYRGRPISDYGDASMFSLHATKAIHSAEGGLLVFKDGAKRRWLDDFVNHGLGGIARRSTNAKMSEPIALLGRLVLAHLPEVRQRMLDLRACYDEALTEIGGLTPVCKIIPGVEGTSGFYPFLLDEAQCGVSRDELMAHLASHNIASRAYFSPPLNEDPRMQAPPTSTPVAKDISSRIVAVPFYADLTEEKARIISDVVRAFIESRA